MLIEIGSMIAVHDPAPELMSWVKSELVVDNPEYVRRVRMGKWTGNTPAKLYLYEQDGSTLRLPYGCLGKMVDYCLDADVRWRPRTSSGLIPYYAEVPLYDYQQEAVDHMMWQACGILEAPAGSGKTQMGIALILKKGLKALWITHTSDLLKQSRERAERYIPRSMTGAITAGKVEIGEGITFATVQTLVHLDLDRYRDAWDMIIVDECHRVKGTPSVVSMFSKVLNALDAPCKIGLTATVHRADGMIKAMHALLGPVAYTVPAEAVADKIMRVTVQAVPTGVGQSAEYLGSDGMLDYAALISYITRHEGRNELITRLMKREPEESFLILSDRLEHLETLMNLLPEGMRERAVTINGKMTSKTERAKREAAVEQMRTGEKRYLFATYSLAKEGLDIPRLSRLIMAAPQADYAIITQSIGRIARTFEGKSTPVCYDLVDNIPYLIKRYKNRCTSYRKAGCEIL